MSQFLGTSARIVRAVENDTSLPQENHLSDQIINADIQVRSIGNVSYAVGSSVPANILPEPCSPEDDVDKQRAANMQMWWDEAIAKNMS